MYEGAAREAIENWPMKREKVPGLVSAIDDQDHALEKLQAIVGDLVNRLDFVTRPSEPEPRGPELTEAVPNWSPAVARLRASEQRIKRIQQIVGAALDRLDA